MQTTNFFPAHEPQPEELSDISTKAGVNLTRRLEVLLQPGILATDKLFDETGDAKWHAYGSVPFAISNPSGLDLDIGPGIAFSRVALPSPGAYEMIEIAPGTADAYDNTAGKTNSAAATDSLGNPIPKSTGNEGLTLPAVDAVYDIYVRYLHAVNTGTTPGGDPNNNYTVDPDTGDVGYVYNTDGYCVFYDGDPYFGAATAEDVLIGSVTVSGGSVTEISYAGRSFANISSPIVHSVIPDGGSYPVTSAYVAGETVTLSEHVKAVGDVARITKENPHGVGVEHIYTNNGDNLQDVLSSSYVGRPENFQSNGIVDLTASIDGAFKPSHDTGPGFDVVEVGVPASGQYAYLNGAEIYSDSALFATEWTNNTLTPTPVGAGVPFRCAFPATARASGYYYVCMVATVEDGVPGYLLTAFITAETNLEKICLLDAADLPSSDYIILAAVHYDQSTGLLDMTDPQTGDTNLKVIDLRRFGVIGDNQLATERRATSAVQTDMWQVGHNMRIYKRDLEIKGTSADGSTGGKLRIHNGTRLDDGEVTRHGIIETHTGNIRVNDSGNSNYWSTVFIPGEIKMFAGAAAPNGWALCQGQAVSRSGVYKRLFDAIGTTYGSGDDATTFNLPDFRGRVPVGLDPEGARVSAATALGVSGGAETHTLSEAEMPAHVHSDPLNGSDSDVYPNGGSYNSGSPYGAGPSAHSTESKGGGQPHNNMPPYIAVNYIIKL